MGILRHITAISILAAVLTSCEEEFMPKVDAEPVLCINSLITAGARVEYKVTRTRLYTDNVDGADFTVKDATVSIYVNGEQQGPDYIAAEGDHIRIVAESPTYGHAEAEVTVPEAVTMKALKYTPSRLEVWQDNCGGYEMLADMSFNITVELEVSDNPDAENYFYLSCSGIEPELGYFDKYTWNFGSLNYDSEPIFSEHIGVFESINGGDAYGFTFFTDRQFQGQSYTLHVQFTNCGYYVDSQEWNQELLDCGYKFTLHTISKSYYNWNNYIWQRENGMIEDLGNIGFGDPIWGYSNVSTGAGVVAAESISSTQINLADFLQSVILKEQ